MYFYLPVSLRLFQSFKRDLNEAKAVQGPTIQLMMGMEGGVVISGQQDFFFLATWWAGYFSLPSFLCRIFFPQKSVMFTFTECIYICIVVIAVIVLIWSCKALKCCELYKIIIVQLHVTKMLYYIVIILLYLTIIPRARFGYEMMDGQRGAQCRVGYNHLISNKPEWNNCCIKNPSKSWKTRLKWK